MIIKERRILYRGFPVFPKFEVSKFYNRLEKKEEA